MVSESNKNLSATDPSTETIPIFIFGSPNIQEACACLLYNTVC